MALLQEERAKARAKRRGGSSSAESKTKSTTQTTATADAATRAPSGATAAAKQQQAAVGADAEARWAAGFPAFSLAPRGGSPARPEHHFYRGPPDVIAAVGDAGVDTDDADDSDGTLGAAVPTPIATDDASRGGVYYFPNWVSKEDETRLLEQVYLAPAPSWVNLRARRLQRWGGDPHARGPPPSTCTSCTSSSSSSSSSSSPSSSLPASSSSPPTGDPPSTPHTPHTPHTPRSFTANPLPPWLAALCARTVEDGVFDPSLPPNHGLINEYCEGEGILAHKDGPVFFPTVATLSLGDPCILRYHRPNPKGGTEAAACMSLVLEPRSLVVTTGVMYTEFLHSIAQVGVGGEGGGEEVTDTSCRNAPPGTVVVREGGTRVSCTIRRVAGTKVNAAARRGGGEERDGEDGVCGGGGGGGDAGDEDGNDGESDGKGGDAGDDDGDGGGAADGQKRNCVMPGIP